MKNVAKGPLAGSIDLYLAHKRSLGKRLLKVPQRLYVEMRRSSLPTSGRKNKRGRVTS